MIDGSCYFFMKIIIIIRTKKINLIFDIFILLPIKLFGVQIKTRVGDEIGSILRRGVIERNFSLTPSESDLVFQIWPI